MRQWDKVKRSYITLVDYLKEYEQEKFVFSTSTLKGRCDLRLKIETYLKEIGYPDIVMVNVDVDVWRGFIDFLRYARNGMCKGRQCHQQRCGISSSGSLNVAPDKVVRDGVLSTHPLKSISSKEKYQLLESKREYLTLEKNESSNGCLMSAWECQTGALVYLLLLNLLITACYTELRDCQETGCQISWQLQEKREQKA